ncbi:MAG: acyl--CoA ligase [Betaproteobacteria bacterium]|nr:MAG: acyl--CoA ligase [Betaproteobacteria bacterium]
MDIALPPDPPFRAITDLIREHARARPAQPALLAGDARLSYAELDALMDRVAASLQRDGLKPGDAIATCAHTSPRYAAVFLGALRAGAVVAPLAPSVTATSFASMLSDAQARWLFVDGAANDLLPAADDTLCRIALDTKTPGLPFEQWLAPHPLHSSHVGAGTIRAHH